MQNEDRDARIEKLEKRVRELESSSKFVHRSREGERIVVGDILYDLDGGKWEVVYLGEHFVHTTNGKFTSRFESDFLTFEAPKTLWDIYNEMLEFRNGPLADSILSTQLDDWAASIKKIAKANRSKCSVL